MQGGWGNNNGANWVNNNNFAPVQAGWGNAGGGNWGGQQASGGNGVSVNVSINGQTVCHQEC
jgi:hypothetical protein